MSAREKLERMTNDARCGTLFRDIMIRELDAYRDEVAHELAEKIQADADRNEDCGVTGQYIVGMKRAKFLITPRSKEQ